MEIIGWLGSIIFGLSAVPQAWKAHKDGSSDGMSWGFLGLWLTGEILTLAYVLSKDTPPLLFNYVANLACLVVILKYKFAPREI